MVNAGTRYAASVLVGLMLVGLLAGCVPEEPIEPTGTPVVVVVTATPDWGATPTKEQPDPSKYGQVINHNHELEHSEVEVFLASVDGRSQCLPDGHNIIWWPGVEYPTPPWVHCDPDNSGGGYLLVDVSYMQGTLLYEVPQTFSWHADRCYVMNVMGLSGVRHQTGGSLANLAIVAYLGKRDGTGYAPLGRKAVTPLGPFDEFWYFTYDDEPFELYWGVVADFAAYEGSIRFERVTVKERPMRECAGVPSL